MCAKLTNTSTATVKKLHMLRPTSGTRNGEVTKRQFFSSGAALVGLGEPASFASSVDHLLSMLAKCRIQCSIIYLHFNVSGYCAPSTSQKATSSSQPDSKQQKKIKIEDKQKESTIHEHKKIQRTQNHPNAHGTPSAFKNTFHLTGIQKPTTKSTTKKATQWSIIYLKHPLFGCFAGIIPE